MRKLDYTKMGMRIRQTRKAKGWTQHMLAKEAGISMSFLGHIERGSRIMSLDTFAGICCALGASADELLWGVARPSDFWICGICRIKAEKKTVRSWAQK